jgi:mannose-6-phosphate isomerase-like protein (cupin superfamily)
MDAIVNLAEKLALLDAPFHPGIVAYFNDNKVAVVKVLGEFVWHRHDDTDDLFLVLSGRLVIELRDGKVELGPGELYVVPRGVEHRPRADIETHVLLLEPRGTANTGERGGAMTVPEVEI